MTYEHNLIAVVREDQLEHPHLEAMGMTVKAGDTFAVNDISMGQSSSSVRLRNFNCTFNTLIFDFTENGQPVNIFADPRFNPYLPMFSK